jgi:hypothetical protein
MCSAVIGALTSVLIPVEPQDEQAQTCWVAIVTSVQLDEADPMRQQYRRMRVCGCHFSQVSGVEQEVACSTGNLPGHYEAVKALLNSPNLTDADKCVSLPPCALSSMRGGHPCACCV